MARKRMPKFCRSQLVNGRSRKVRGQRKAKEIDEARSSSWGRVKVNAGNCKSDAIPKKPRSIVGLPITEELL
jgi:hypothetical protein